MNFNKFEIISSGTRLTRFWYNPFRYVYGILYSYGLYPFIKVPLEVSRKTFFGKQMVINLPASLDIYITGGKSHKSEIALAKFLNIRLSCDDTFIDVGAHYGYFSLLASSIVGKDGSVVSLEPSPTSFELLKRNTNEVDNVTIRNIAISDKEGIMTFFEFSNKYSEYNTFDKKQFEGEPWYKRNIPRELQVESKTLSQIIKDNKPRIIKIDVEGAEYQVVKGLEPMLKVHDPIIVMEYLNVKRGNSSHNKAHYLLKSHGYKAFSIDMEGNIHLCENIDEHLESENLDSDNIVFMKESS